jgi:hypothetical protein
MILLLILYINHGKFIIIQGLKKFFYELLIILFYFSAIILFIIPEREFNIGDQMLIEQGLLSYENCFLLVKHVTFIDICQYCFLDSKGILYL